MRLSGENTREGRHLTPEERIALQAEEIKQLQQENEQLKDENASLRNWNACEEELHNELLESDKRRWELESELEDANNYRAGLEVIVDKLRAQVARMREALEEATETIENIYEKDTPQTEKYRDILNVGTTEYHNPADVVALRKAREALYAARFDVLTKETDELAREALAEIDKVIGGKEDV
jgi:chromosome segregation ATPase